MTASETESLRILRSIEHPLKVKTAQSVLIDVLGPTYNEAKVSTLISNLIQTGHIILMQGGWLHVKA